MILSRSLTISCVPRSHKGRLVRLMWLASWVISQAPAKHVLSLPLVYHQTHRITTGFAILRLFYQRSETLRSHKCHTCMSLNLSGLSTMNVFSQAKFRHVIGLETPLTSRAMGGPGRRACFRGFSGVVCLFTRALITVNFSQNLKLKILQRSRANL